MENNKYDYWTRERLCEEAFLSGGPFFLVTSENLNWLLFETVEDFKSGTNIIAVSIKDLRVRILNEVLMNNHLHLVLEGVSEDVDIFIKRVKQKIRRFLLQKGKDLNQWNVRKDQITDLTHLRNVIIYVARNPYVARRDSTPTGYRWGSSHLLFNDNICDYAPGIPYADISYDEKRMVCRSHDINLPESYRYHGGMILRTSFVDYHRAEEFFASGNQYFQWLSRRKESDITIARWIGESILLPNEDVFRIVSDWYNVKAITSLSIQQRLEAAPRMKADLNSNNKQIAQVLKLPLKQIDELFPSAK